MLGNAVGWVLGNAERRVLGNAANVAACASSFRLVPPTVLTAFLTNLTVWVCCFPPLRRLIIKGKLEVGVGASLLTTGASLHGHTDTPRAVTGHEDGKLSTQGGRKRRGGRPTR